ncbi:hypothetical protein HG530_015248 [Fusarium avenaceum]|nr:hypothetical protein HG530_015248 [Fusarium avenaceum]
MDSRKPLIVAKSFKLAEAVWDLGHHDVKHLARDRGLVCFEESLCHQAAHCEVQAHTDEQPDWGSSPRKLATIVTGFLTCVLADALNFDLFSNASEEAHQQLIHDSWICGLSILVMVFPSLPGHWLSFSDPLMRHLNKGVGQDFLEILTLEVFLGYLGCCVRKLTN